MNTIDTERALHIANLLGEGSVDSEMSDQDRNNEAETIIRALVNQLNNPEPNGYIVHFKKWEGDYRAGGWGERTAEIASLADAKHYDGIISVKPVYSFQKLFEDAVPQTEINKAIADEKERLLRVKRIQEIKKTEDELTRLKSK